MKENKLGKKLEDLLFKVEDECLADNIELQIEQLLSQQKNEILEILTDEIEITHTSKRGKTSGLTSAYMRIKNNK